MADLPLEIRHLNGDSSRHRPLAELEATLRALPELPADSGRLTLIVRSNHIEHVFYPVFPPDTHAEAVIAWLKSRV